MMSEADIYLWSKFNGFSDIVHNEFSFWAVFLLQTIFKTKNVYDLLYNRFVVHWLNE